MSDERRHCTNVYLTLLNKLTVLFTFKLFKNTLTLVYSVHSCRAITIGTPH